MTKWISMAGFLVPLVACSLPTTPTSVSTPSSSVVAVSAGDDTTVRTRHIVNIDARINDTRRPVMVSLEAGTYVVTPIGTDQGGAWDGWNAWDATTCTDSTGCPFTKPTGAYGWLNTYVVISPSLATATVDGRPLAPQRLQESASALYYSVGDGKVHTDARSALSAGQASTFTLAKSGMVGFSIADDPISDNVGGMSLEIVGRSTSGQ